jgi:hypothetical protein
MPLEADFDEILDWADSFCIGRDATPPDRLGASLFVPSHNRRDRLMALFTAYIDASGNSADQPFVIVTGYIANWVQWRLLEDQWKRIHAEFGADIPFHMAEFFSAHTNPKYATQKNARADYIAISQIPGKGSEFLKKLTIAQMGMANCGVSCIIQMSVYNQVSSVLKLREVIPPYALGARMCVARIRKWEAEFDIQEPVECIFEEGDFGQGKFTNLMLSEGNDPPTYKKKKDFAGLQAADYYAWEQAFFLKRELVGQQLPPREALSLQLNLIPKLHLGATATQLIKLCESKGIDPMTGISYVKK